MNAFIIDNCVVSKFNEGISITPVSTLKRRGINVSKFKKITFGDREKDNKILSQFADGNLKYDDVILEITRLYLNNMMTH